MKTLNKPFLTGAALSFFGLGLLAELFLRLTVPTGFWYKHFDLSGDMTSLAELRDRIQYAAPKENRVLLLGDSVLGASALMEHRVPQARAKTLNRMVIQQLGSKGYNALSLGSDGLLLPDIEALNKEGSRQPAALIVLLLNFRMFAKDFTEGPKALSRGFLLGNLPEDVQKRLAPPAPPSEESRLSDRLYAGMCDHWFLFRETQMLKTLWYYPSQKDFFQRLLERVAGRSEAQAEMGEAALKLKTASFYQEYTWDEKGLPFLSLKSSLDQWSSLVIPVIVVLTPQNTKFLGSDLDRPSYEKNRKKLAAFMKRYAKAGVRYEDWSNRYPSSVFFDHCHLKPEGNERYAKDLAEFVAGKSLK